MIAGGKSLCDNNILGFDIIVLKSIKLTFINLTATFQFDCIVVLRLSIYEQNKHNVVTVAGNSKLYSHLSIVIKIYEQKVIKLIYLLNIHACKYPSTHLQL